MIGIRQADGSFYEIVGDAQAARKRLVLSAARSDQHGVKIDLYRSVDGTLDEANSLGSIALDDPEGLGYQDIEFRVDVDAQGQLEASAALPGQPPKTLSVDLTQFRSPRSDSDILDDESLATGDLDTLDDRFTLDPEAMTLDLPELDLPPLSDEPLSMDEPLADEEALADDEGPRRSDADILGDESLASLELDDLGDFDADGLEEASLEQEADPEVAEVPSESGPEEFDLGDLDAGFGSEEEGAAEAPAPAEDWEKISFDDMDSMEFMDTGDEISAPRAASAQPVPGKATDSDDLRFDDEAPLELNDLDSDLSDLPALGDAPRSSLDDLDHEFLAPPELTELPEFAEELPAAPSEKPAKASKPARTPQPRGARGNSSGALDKTALFLSLASLSLLVLLILILLFLNMIKAPQTPTIQPEVMRWKPVASLVPASPGPNAVIDLGSPNAPSFESSSVLEVPRGLKTATVSLKLGAGESVADAERRFGAPAQRQGNLLLW